MSNSALEALASGLPLVVSATGGMEELVTAGKNGCFVDPKDTPSFAQTLADLANNTTDLVAFGWESRRRAEARGWNIVAENFRNVLEISRKK
jgi:glycosyltransferase involved in cell wall biosynthesis